jgi:hypothetical protein
VYYVAEQLTLPIATYSVPDVDYYTTEAYTCRYRGRRELHAIWLKYQHVYNITNIQVAHFSARVQHYSWLQMDVNY